MLGSGGVGQAILSKTPPVTVIDFSSPYPKASDKQISLLDSLAAVWTKLLVMIVELVAAFAVSYVAFKRMDIR